jgi:gluconate 2-dehydrogenase subunit 3-like protein
MRRRRFLQAIAAAPAVPALVAQQQAPAPQNPATPPALGGRGGRGGPGGGPAMLEVTQPDAVASPVAQFFTPPQFAALRRISALIQPSGKAGPGALECNVPEFLDFLIGASPADRQQLYRGGLDALNLQSKTKFNKAFGDLDDTQAHTILQPLLVAVPWVHDPPKDPLKHFIFAVRQDVPMATRNSPEFAAAGASTGRRGGGPSQVWDPIDPVYRG